MSVFQMFLDFDWQFLHVSFIVLQKTITIKDAILHLKKIMLFLLRWKKEN